MTEHTQPMDGEASSDKIGDRTGASLVVVDPSLGGATPLLARIAQSEVSVLIRGEPGTGKEVLARTLHALSGRRGELVTVHAAALAGELLEIELFGCARTPRTGALERAGRGTVLVDELGELSLEAQ